VQRAGVGDGEPDGGVRKAMSSRLCPEFVNASDLAASRVKWVPRSVLRYRPAWSPSAVPNTAVSSVRALRKVSPVPAPLIGRFTSGRPSSERENPIIIPVAHEFHTTWTDVATAVSPRHGAAGAAEYVAPPSVERNVLGAGPPMPRLSQTVSPHPATAVPPVPVVGAAENTRCHGPVTEVAV